MTTLLFTGMMYCLVLLKKNNPPPQGPLSFKVPHSRVPGGFFKNTLLFTGMMYYFKVRQDNISYQ